MLLVNIHTKGFNSHDKAFEKNYKMWGYVEINLENLTIWVIIDNQNFCNVPQRFKPCAKIWEKREYVTISTRNLRLCWT